MPITVDLDTTDHGACGDHLCAVYRTDKAWKHIVTTYVSAGLKAGNRVSYFTSERTPDEIRHVLERHGVDTKVAEKIGALRIIDSEYEGFNPTEMMTGLALAIDEAQQDGFAGIRFIGEMGWATDPNVSEANLALYERMVTQYYASKKVDGICLYDVRLFNSDKLDALTALHPGLARNHPSLISLEAKTSNLLPDMDIMRTLLDS